MPGSGEGGYSGRQRRISVSIGWKEGLQRTKLNSIITAKSYALTEETPETAADRRRQEITKTCWKSNHHEC